MSFRMSKNLQFLSFNLPFVKQEDCMKIYEMLKFTVKMVLSEAKEEICPCRRDVLSNFLIRLTGIRLCLVENEGDWHLIDCSWSLSDQTSITDTCICYFIERDAEKVWKIIEELIKNE